MGADAGRELVDGAVAVVEAARVQDTPWWPARTAAGFRLDLVHGWDGDPSGYTVAVDGGRVVGVLEVGRPRWDNRHLGPVRVTVDPVRRRRGIGRVLAEAGVEQVTAEGRSLLWADVWDLPAVEAFCGSLGMQRVYREAARRLDLDVLDRDRIAALQHRAAAHAGGYELLRIAGPVPDRLMDLTLELTAAINDAPTGEADVEDELFDAERIRCFEAVQRAHGRRTYRLVARERGTGAPAGHTVVVVDGVQPWSAMQLDTSVVRAHRGHRLGLLLKTAMLGWLAEVEPQLRQVDTWNATDNSHMLAVNDALGCRVLGTASGWQRALGPTPVTRSEQAAAGIS